MTTTASNTLPPPPSSFSSYTGIRRYLLDGADEEIGEPGAVGGYVAILILLYARSGGVPQARPTASIQAVHG